MVDDVPQNLSALDALLSSAGASVVQARSGDEALKLLLRREFALIILDVQMPELDGFETAQLIRSRPRTKHIPIIFLTAFHRGETNVTRGYGLGAVDFLFKPIVPEILTSKVNVFLDLYRIRKETERQAALIHDVQKRAHDLSLQRAKEEYEASLLREEMERERRVSEALSRQADKLARLLADNTRNEALLQRSNERLTLLAETATHLLRSDARDRFDDVQQRLVRHLGVDICVHYRVDPVRPLLKLVSSWGTPADKPPLDEVPFELGVAGRVAAERQRYMVEDARESPQQIAGAWGEEVAAFACFPLLANDKLLGTLTFATRAPRKFSVDDVAVMQAVTDQMAFALDRERLIRELHDRDRRKDEFLAMLAHELRNPLAPIRTAVELLQSGHAPRETRGRALAAADRQLNNITRLVDDLLDVSRITTGKIELRRSTVELKYVLDAAVETASKIMQDRGHALTVSLPDDPVLIDGDPTRLTQVFANLLHNAAKYTDPGGTISVCAAVEGTEVVVGVIDNGLGIRPELVPRVFDLFVQEDSGADRARGGLGLGLTLVRELVSIHGGNVTCQSEGLGKGSTFTVRLPCKVQQKNAAKNGASSTAMERAVEARMTPLRIVLVEDSDDIRDMLTELLELEGHTVATAQDGLQGVELVLRKKPQVALIDIGLPGLDGYTVAERVRASESSIRLIAMTGYGQPEERQRALDAGFDAHLVKPVSLHDLSTVLKRLC